MYVLCIKGIIYTFFNAAKYLLPLPYLVTRHLQNPFLRRLCRSYFLRWRHWNLRLLAFWIWRFALHAIPEADQ